MEYDRQPSRLWPFLIGFFAPLIPAFLGFLYASLLDTSGKELIFLLSITPLVAICFLIYEINFKNRFMMYGTLVMLLLMISFLVWLNNAMSNMCFGYGC